MTRQIKFRAWSKEGKRMFYPNKENWGFRISSSALGLGASRLLIICPDGDLVLKTKYAGDENSEYEVVNDKYELMQFTGLLDKNGKEIYEGDIVEWKYINAWQRNEVKWVEGGFVSIMTAFKEDLNEMQDLSLISKLNCEVIGNIYESPELLNNIEK